MSPEAVATTFSALLIAGLLGGFALFVSPPTRTRFLAYIPWISALVAIGATGGSLYFSERAGFVPCELCWFQRIAMYPMAVILPVAAFRRDRQIFNYTYLLAGIGLVVSAYHIQVQLFPDQSNACSLDATCTAKWVEGFGIFTIPQMAAMAFFLIIMLSIASTFDSADSEDEPPSKELNDRETPTEAPPAIRSGQAS